MTGRRLRFLFAMFQGGGNIPLIMPIVAELVRRGHAVRVIAGPGIRGRQQPVSADFARRLEASGATRVPFVAPDADPVVNGPPVRGLAFGWLPTRLDMVSRFLARTTLWSPTWASNISDELQRTQTDVLVCDYWLFGAIAAGQASRVPTAVIVHNAFPQTDVGQPRKGSGYLPAKNPMESLRQLPYGWAYERIWARDGLPAHNATRASLGLPPVRSPFDECDLADRVLILGYESFDFPAKHLPANVRYVGSPIDDAAVAADSWASPWPSDDPRPLVLVSMSTLPQGQGPVMRNIIEAVGSMPVRALVTLGPSLNVDDFAAPQNVLFAKFIPHSAVLPHAAAIVSQCGLSTLTKALRHGVPLVCLPILGDQPDNAARIVAKGAGLRLRPDAAPQQIRVAIARILHEPSFREAAQRLGEVMHGERAEERAAYELEALVQRESS